MKRTCFVLSLTLSLPVWLDQVRPGDKVRFQADKVNGKLAATQIEVVQ